MFISYFLIADTNWRIVMSFVLEFDRVRGGVRVGGLWGLDNVSGLFIYLLYLPILFFVIWFVILCCFFFETMM